VTNGGGLSSSVHYDFLRLSFMFSFICALNLRHLLSGTRPGGGKGSCHRPPADCEEVVADGKQERTVYNIVIIQHGRTLSMNHHRRRRASARLPLRQRYFICLIVLAFGLYRSWRRKFCPVFLSAVAARCKLPFALRPGLSQE